MFITTAVQLTPENMATLGPLLAELGLLPDQAESLKQMLAFRQLKNENVQDLVLDLRFNSGGFLYIALGAASMVAGPSAENRTFSVDFDIAAHGVTSERDNNRIIQGPKAHRALGEIRRARKTRRTLDAPAANSRGRADETRAADHR